MRGLGPPAHESLGIAEGRHPLRCVAHRLVVVHLHHSLLVFGRQQRDHRGCLHVAAPDPLVAAAAALVVAVPVGQGLSSVHRRTARLLRLGHERGVVLLGGLVGIWADDLCDRIVEIAVAPMGGPVFACPHICELAWRIAARVALVGPGLPIEVEVLRGEQVARQRCHTRGRRRRCRPSTPPSALRSRGRIALARNNDLSPPRCAWTGRRARPAVISASNAPAATVARNRPIGLLSSAVYSPVT